MKLPNNQSKFFRTGPNMGEVKLALKELKRNGWYEPLRATQDREHFKSYIHTYANILHGIELAKEQTESNLLIPSDVFYNNRKVRLENKFAIIARGYEANRRAIRTGVPPNEKDLAAIAEII